MFLTLLENELVISEVIILTLEAKQVYKLSSPTHHCLCLLPTLILSCQVDIWNGINCFSELFPWFASQFAVCTSLWSTAVKRFL